MASDVTLASDATLDVTVGHGSSNGLATLNGWDEKGLDNLATSPITCSQSGTTITASLSVIEHLNPQQLTGTVSTSGTAITGTGTKFLSELRPYDMLGTDATYGFARVDTVTSDTAATFTATLAPPGGNIPGGTTCYALHTPTVEVNDSGTIAVPNTINAAGTSIVWGTSATVGAGAPLTIGKLMTAVNLPAFAWLVSNGSTPGGLVSYQRSSLLAPPSGYTQERRLTGLLTSGGTVVQHRVERGSGQYRRVSLEQGSPTSATGGSTATTWTRAQTSLISPGAVRAVCGVSLNDTSGSDRVAYFRASGKGDATVSRALRVGCEASTQTSHYIEIPLDESAAFDHANSGASLLTDVYISGWVEYVA